MTLPRTNMTLARMTRPHLTEGRRAGGLGRCLTSWLSLALLLALVAGCSGPSSSQQPTGDASTAAAPARQTVLRYVSRFEPPTLAAKLPVGGGTSDFLRRPFNAGLAVNDSQRNPRPVLA